MSDPNLVDPEKDNQPVVEPPVDNSMERLAKLEEDYKTLLAKDAEKSRLLDASKKEALRLKSESDLLKAEKEAKAKPTEELSEQELFDKYLKESPTFQERLSKVNQEKYNDVMETQKDKFLESHPEYLPENDKDDTKWKSLLEELRDYVVPENPKDWGKRLLKAHKNISPDNSLEKGKSIAMAQANIDEQAKLGGGAGGITPARKLTPEQQKVSEGFQALRPDYYK